jgi:Mg2+/Co2+ transporter CorB
LVNAASAALAGVIGATLFGEDKWVLGLATLSVSFVILVFSEITPKVLGARYADQISQVCAFILKPLLAISRPVVGFTNLLVTGLLRLLRLKPAEENHATRLSAEELRVLVLESGSFIPQKHRSILLNLFDLEDITVEDVMIPRGSIEAIDISEPMAKIKTEISTCYHTRLPVFDGDWSNVVGVLHHRRLLAALIEGELDHAALRERLAKPYFIPGTTPIYSQLQYFQENQQRIALVVDEYGEIEGLVTLEDIIEELIGKFTTTQPSARGALSWDKNGSVLVDGTRSLRELNRALGLDLPLAGPKTLNGLILEHFRDIPEGEVSIRVSGVTIEVVQTQDRMVKTARIFRPKGD